MTDLSNAEKNALLAESPQVMGWGEDAHPDDHHWWTLGENGSRVHQRHKADWNPSESLTDAFRALEAWISADPTNRSVDIEQSPAQAEWIVCLGFRYQKIVEFDEWPMEKSHHFTEHASLPAAITNALVEAVTDDT